MQAPQAAGQPSAEKVLAANLPSSQAPPSGRGLQDWPAPATWTPPGTLVLTVQCSRKPPHTRGISEGRCPTVDHKNETCFLCEGHGQTCAQGPPARCLPTPWAMSFGFGFAFVTTGLSLCPAPCPPSHLQPLALFSSGSTPSLHWGLWLFRTFCSVSGQRQIQP